MSILTFSNALNVHMFVLKKENYQQIFDREKANILTNEIKITS